MATREVLRRKLIKVKTKYGKVKIKLGLLAGQVITAAPEYEELKKLARKHRLPINIVDQNVKRLGFLFK